jgi:hypothetical protein
MSREELKEFRPELFLEQNTGTKTVELFQNEVLRPIIKYQHNLIIGSVNSQSLFKTILNDRGPRLEFQEKVKQFITSQSALKNQLIGYVIGLMTSSEFEFYLKNQPELNKRIHGMLCQRVADSFY